MVDKELTTLEVLDGLRACIVYQISCKNYERAHKLEGYKDSFSKFIVKSYDGELTSGQRRFGRDLIAQNGNAEILARLGLINPEQEQKEQEETANKTPEQVQADAARVVSEISETEKRLKDLISRMDELDNYDYEERSRIERQIEEIQKILEDKKRALKKIFGNVDGAIVRALRTLKPYMTGDKILVANAVESANKYNTERRGFSYPKYRDIAVEFCSNYREQIPQEFLVPISAILPSVTERNPFYTKFTEKYIKFLLHVAKAAVARSLISRDEKVDEFIKTGGFGTEITVFNGEVQANRFRNVVKSVYEKLYKNAKAGRLGALSNYILSESAFEDFAENVEEAESIADVIEQEQRIVYTTEQKAIALELVQMLAGMCDHAKTWDKQGFSKTDTEAGHAVARQLEIRDEQMPTAVFWCRKYRRQLPEDSLAELGIGKKKSAKKKPVERIGGNIARFLQLSMSKL